MEKTRLADFIEHINEIIASAERKTALELDAMKAGWDLQPFAPPSDDGSPMAAIMIATDKPCDTCKRKMHKSPIKLDKWYCANCKKYKD